MWILIDNYDSFTHILHHYLLKVHSDVRIYRNDTLTVEEIKHLKPDRIIISPGPCTPKESGITMELIHHFHKSIPILGVCLGHQALGMYFGADLTKAIQPMHGKTSLITQVHPHQIFDTIPSQFTVMRYHSLIIKNWSDELIPLAQTDEGELMAFAHKYYPCIGLQFHPESVMTEYGQLMIENWSRMYS